MKICQKIYINTGIDFFVCGYLSLKGEQQEHQGGLSIRQSIYRD
jgi:hypothetical protein